MVPAIDLYEHDTRRAFERVPVDCAAQLVTPGSYRSGRLRDLSRSGARLEIDNPPSEGTTAMLRWLSHDSLCTVVWASPVACGLAFVRPLAGEVVAASGVLSEGDPVPSPARLTQITFGKRRLTKKPVLTLNQPDEPERYNWSLVLANAPGARMTAAEEMFFYGSPLAHIAFKEYTALSGHT